MNIVVQEEPYGCGIASVANIVGATYPEVKILANSLGISADDELLYSDTSYVRDLLNFYRFETDAVERSFHDWDNLPNECLLAINYREENGQPYWHWVVFRRINSGSVVMDSSMSLDVHERYDFDNINPKWFIEIFRSE